MIKQNWNKRTMLRNNLDLVAVLMLVVIYIAFPESLVRNVLGWLFLFLPGYSLARLLVKDWRRDFLSASTSILVFSISVDPLLGNIIQTVTLMNSYSILAALLVFSLPILLTSNLRIQSSDREIVEDTEKSATKSKSKAFLVRNVAFFGALAIGFGLYIQASLGAVAPRGYDIYGHMNLVNGMVESGEALLRPDLNVVSNFYHFTYAEIVMLTGLDVLKAALIAQVLLGGMLTMTVYYFADFIIGSSVAAFFSSVLFIAGPPIYAGATPYFYYFHPMWVSLAIFPFALVFVHKCISKPEERNVGVASILVVAVFLYHLTVGLMLGVIILVDSLFILKSEWKLLIPRLMKIIILSILVSAVVTIPFLSNMSNPFKYIYRTGGLETLGSMLFGVSAYTFSSPLVGWDFLTTNLQEFTYRVLPLVALGAPVILLSLWKKKQSSMLLLAGIIVGVLGVIQPYFGFAFMPQRFVQPMLIFGAVSAGLMISYILVIPTIKFSKEGRVIKVRLGISRRSPTRSVLVVALLGYVALSTFILLYSPSRQSVLAAELYLTNDDLTAIQWVNNNTPKDARILMDQYLQFFFTGVTGRPRLYSITAERPLYKVWDVYPVNVYIKNTGTDPASMDVDYIVISRWCYTTWDFVGRAYFDESSKLVLIWDDVPLYAVYKLNK